MSDLPLVHTFRTPYGYYFYEANRNQIVSTTQEVFDLLNDPGEIADLDLVASTSPLSAMRKMGYLSTNRPRFIEHPYTKYLAEMLNRKIEKITLQLTQDCNLRCRYCAYTSDDVTKQRTHSRKTMTWDTAKQTIDFLYDHSCDSKAVTIGFYGGEPLLAFDLLCHVVEYTEKKFEGKSYKFSMTTNGTILSDTIIQYLYMHNIDLMVSIDGPKEIHDINRVFAASGKGSFDTLLKNIQKISVQYPSYMRKLMTYMVVDPSNDLDCYNKLFLNNDLLIKYNTNSTYVDTALNDFPINTSADFVDKDSYGMFLSFLYHYGIIQVKDIPPVALAGYRSVYDKHWLLEPIGNLPEVMAPGGPCVPGAMRLLVNVQGDLYPCEKCSEVSAAMNIGSLSDGFDIDKAKKLLNVAQMNSDRCVNCWALIHCSICASQLTDGDDLSMELMEMRCNQVKSRVEKEMYAVILLREINHAKSTSKGISV